MTPAFIVAFLFWSMMIFAALSFGWDGTARAILRRHWTPIILLTVITVGWRVPWHGAFFHGLEYEDSYIYTVAGRQIAEHVRPPADSSAPPFSFQVCAVGSISDCDLWEPFPEHVIGYPYVIGLASRALGYTPAIGSLINLATAAASVVLVFLIALLMTDDALVAMLCGLTFAAVPVFAVYGLETSAEPFSCFCILLALWFFIRMRVAAAVGRVSAGIRWCAYTSALLFSMTVKREDALLALLLPLLMLIPSAKGEVRSRRLWRWFITASSLLAILLSWRMQLWATSQNEQVLLHQFPLTPLRLLHFTISFISSFAVMKWYGGTFVAVLGGAIVAIRRKSAALIPLLLLIAFILVYATHVRSYYEMASGRVSPESALRFSMNLMGLWSLMAGLGAGWFIRVLQGLKLLRSRVHLQRYALTAVTSALLCVSGAAVYRLRRDVVEDETNSRVMPAMVAAEATEDKGADLAYILTMDPLVIQMYEGKNVRVVDLESIDGNILHALITSRVKLVLLKQDDRFQVADLERYGEPIRRLLLMPSTRIDGGEGFSVMRIDPATRF